MTQLLFMLQVSIELGTHSKSFSNEKSGNVKIAANPEREHVGRSQRSDMEVLTAPAMDHPRLNVWTPQTHTREPSNPPGIRTSPLKSSRAEEEPQILLHALLMVPDGKKFSCGPQQAPNVFLNSKLFWCDETARSTVSWGQANPTFNFVQVGSRNSAVSVGRNHFISFHCHSC